MLYGVPNAYLNGSCLGVYENQFLTGFPFYKGIISLTIYFYHINYAFCKMFKIKIDKILLAKSIPIVLS